MRTTAGPLAAARRWTTSVLVAAALATGVVGVHLAGPATSTVLAQGGSAVTSGSARTSEDGSDGSSSDEKSTTTTRPRSLFGVVPLVQSGNGQAQTKTSGS
jgi:hypothetical protein